MKRVVIDANVIISAILSPSASPAKVLKLVTDGKIEIIVSYPILHEFITTLLYPRIQKRHGLSKHQVSEKIFHLAEFGKLVHPENKLNIIKDDPSDNMYLECAIEGEADFIISGDKHLKDLKSYKGIKIIDPFTFLKIGL